MSISKAGERTRSKARRGDKKIPWVKGQKHPYAKQNNRCRLPNRAKGELEQRELPRACNGLCSIRGSELAQNIGDVFPRG